MRFHPRPAHLLAAALFLAATSTFAAPIPAVVAPAWLADQLATTSSGITVIDARPSLKEYLTGHLPGAQPLAVDGLRSASGGVPVVLFPPEMLRVVVHRLGIARTTPVVVYGERTDLDATYVATVLRVAGVEQVAVLEGGFDRWSAEKRAVTKERRLVPHATDPLVADEKALVGLEAVRAAVESKGAVLLDVRPAEPFAAGHLPGAKNRFWVRDLVPEGQPGAGGFRGEAEIRAELEALGIGRETPVIVYCNSGHQASETFFTMKYRLGYSNVKLYLGSWLEWSMTPETPKEVATPSPSA